MSDDIQRVLEQAIHLAQSGQRSQARELLQQVIEKDPHQAIAWLWLANVADSREARINALQEVLRLDPGNNTARTALEKLGIEIGTIVEEGGAPPSPPSSGPFLSQNELFIIAVVAIVAVIAILSVIVVREVTEEDPTSTPTMTATATSSNTPTPTITLTPSMTFTPPPIRTLPPSFTPTHTYTPSITPTDWPTRTPRPTRTPYIPPTPTPDSRIFGG